MGGRGMGGHIGATECVHVCMGVCYRFLSSILILTAEKEGGAMIIHLLIKHQCIKPNILEVVVYTLGT